MQDLMVINTNILRIVGIPKYIRRFDALKYIAPIHSRNTAKQRLLAQSLFNRLQ
jgi:hypothetical protein